MAAIKIGVDFDCAMLPTADPSPDNAGRLEREVDRVFRGLSTNDWSFASDFNCGSAEWPRYHVTLTVVTSARNARDAAYELDQADRKLARVRQALLKGGETDWQGELRPWRFSVEHPQHWVVCPIPFPERLSPSVPRAPEHTVRQAIGVMMEFCEDRRAAWSGLSVSVEPGGDALRLAAPLYGEVVEGARAFLVAAARGDGRIAGPPPGARTSARLIALAVAAIAAVTVGASFADASLVSLAVLALLVVAIAGWAVSGANRAPWAAPRVVLLGITPMLVIVAFGLIYGGFMSSSTTSVTHAGEPVRSLGDALLLSLNVALTGGIPDLVLTGVVRVLVYVEMLLFIGSVGTNVVVAGRWAVGRLDALLARRPIQRES